MRLIRKIIAFMLAVGVTSHSNPVSLDGTMTPTIVYNTHVFANGEFAKGFVKLKNGFTLPTSATVTFDISETVDGPISLGVDSTLILNHDLYLGLSSITMIDTSAIVGFNKKIFFSHDLNVNLDNRGYLNGIIFNGGGNTLMLNALGGFATFLNFQNTTPGGFEQLLIKSPQTFINVDSVSSVLPIVFRNVDFLMGSIGYVNLSNLLIQGRVRFVGPPGAAFGSASFTSQDTTITIDSDSQLYFGPGIGVLFIYSSSGVVGSPRITFVDTTSNLYLDSATLLQADLPDNSYTHSLTMTGGTLTLSGDVNLGLSSGIDLTSFIGLQPTTPSILTIGDGTLAHDLTVNFLPGSRLILNGNSLLNIKNVN